MGKVTAQGLLPHCNSSARLKNLDLLSRFDKIYLKTHKSRKFEMSCSLEERSKVAAVFTFLHSFGSVYQRMGANIEKGVQKPYFGDRLQI